jgi:hypothetical protein
VSIIYYLDKRRREVERTREAEEVCEKKLGFIYLDNSAAITDGCTFLEHGTGLANF